MELIRRTGMNGGMGVDFSNEELVKAVMKEGWIGTLAGSAVGACDYYSNIATEGRGMKVYHRANEVAMLRKIDDVRTEVPDGVLAVNLMAAMSDFKEMVDIIGRSGKVDLLFVGAGLPRDLPEQMTQYPHMHYAPIVSSARAASAMLKAGIRTGRLPTAFYVELPQFAGGHLGASAKDPNDALDGEKFEAAKLLAEIRAVFEEPDIQKALQEAGWPEIPLILAGGIADENGIARAEAAGADSVSVGTRLLLTQESGLPNNLIEDCYLNREYRVVTGFTSPAGLLSRYLVGPEGQRIDADAAAIRGRCISCIGSARCKFQAEDGELNHYCIADRLTKTRRGEEGGTLFTGTCRDDMLDDPIYKDADGRLYIPTVREVMKLLLGPQTSA